MPYTHQRQNCPGIRRSKGNNWRLISTRREQVKSPSKYVKFQNLAEEVNIYIKMITKVTFFWRQSSFSYIWRQNKRFCLGPRFLNFVHVRAKLWIFIYLFPFIFLKFLLHSNGIFQRSCQWRYHYTKFCYQVGRELFAKKNTLRQSLN